MLQSHFLAGFGQALGFFRVNRIRLASGNRAEGASPGADISQDHERRGVMAPAFPDIRADGFDANRVQAKVLKNLFCLAEVISGG